MSLTKEDLKAIGGMVDELKQSLRQEIVENAQCTERKIEETERNLRQEITESARYVEQKLSRQIDGAEHNLRQEIKDSRQNSMEDDSVAFKQLKKLEKRVKKLEKSFA